MLRNLQTVENTLLYLTAQLSNYTLYGKTPLNTWIAGCGLEWELASGLRCRALSSHRSAVNNTSGTPGITSHLRQAQNHSLRFSKEHWFNVSLRFRALSPQFRWLCIPSASCTLQLNQVSLWESKTERSSRKMQFKQRKLCVKRCETQRLSRLKCADIQLERLPQSCGWSASLTFRPSVCFSV